MRRSKPRTNPRIAGDLDIVSVSFEKIGELLQLPKREVFMRTGLLMELVIVSGYSRSFQLFRSVLLLLITP
jgi:hypothetical protein